MPLPRGLHSLDLSGIIRARSVRKCETSNSLAADDFSILSRRLFVVFVSVQLTLHEYLPVVERAVLFLFTSIVHFFLASTLSFLFPP